MSVLRGRDLPGRPQRCVGTSADQRRTAPRCGKAYPAGVPSRTRPARTETPKRYHVVKDENNGAKDNMQRPLTWNPRVSSREVQKGVYAYGLP